MTSTNERAALYAALAKAQAEMPVVGKNNENSHFKYRYADIADIIRTCAPILTKHGLSVIHCIDFHEDINYLVTYLLHQSGVSLQSRVKITPAKADIQSFGAAITYLRRYSYAAIIGLAISDEDDDGQAAMPEPRGTPQPYSTFLTQEQIEQLDHELQDHPDIKDSLLLRMGIKSFREIPRDKFLGVIKRIREIKDTKSGR